MGKRKGFTFIEIALFLAITAALFIGIALGMNNSIFQQRYDDATQSFLEFMRSIYSQVSNPQSNGKGNSNEAIFGKLIVFGEGTDIQGSVIDHNTQGFPIFVYDVVGSATTNIPTGTVAELLVGLNANVTRLTENRGVVVGAELASPEQYDPRWDSVIDNTAKPPNNEPFVGSILVVRHPRSGTINTLVLENKAIEVNQKVREAKNTNNYSSLKNLLITPLRNGEFRTAEVDFCVNPYGYRKSGILPRQDIRLLLNARNASSVQMIDMDGGNNRCVN